MVETEEALGAEVSGVCRTYCAQVWDEALNEARVEASSMLRKVESVYYPPAIRLSGFSGSKAASVSSEAGKGQGSPLKAPPTTNTSSEDTAKIGDINKEVVQGADLPPAAPKDPPKEKGAFQSMELVLATLPVPLKEDPKGKAQVSSTAATTQPPKNPKDKLVIKMKQ